MNIKIGKNAHSCATCETDFVHEQSVHSLVRVVEQSFEREDFCDDCWDEESAKAAYSSWNMQYYDPKVAEQEPEEAYSPLRQLFYTAVEETTRASMALAYLAAQLLRRQKVFRLIKESKDPDSEAVSILYNDRIGNRLIEVNDPSLAHSELEEAGTQLMRRLSAIENPPEEESNEELSDASTDTTPETETHEHTEVTDNGSSQETAQA